MRYISKGQYVIDTSSDIAVVKSLALKGSNLFEDADNERLACVMADVVAAALNDYDKKQGGL